MTLGHPWQKVEHHWTEPQFGLRVALNSIPRDKVIELHAAQAFAKWHIASERVPQASFVEEFGVEISSVSWRVKSLIQSSAKRSGATQTFASRQNFRGLGQSPHDDYTSLIAVMISLRIKVRNAAFKLLSKKLKLPESTWRSQYGIQSG